MKPVRYPLVWGVVATNLALAACGSDSSSSNDASVGAAGDAFGGSFAERTREARRSPGASSIS